MTLTEKLLSTLRYMLQPVIVAYWVGSAIILFLFRHLLVGEEVIQTLSQSPNPEELMAQLLQEMPTQLFLYSVAVLLVSIVILGKSLDAAKQISEGNVCANSFHPVPRIGWQGLGYYIAGLILIGLAMFVALVLCFTVVGLLGALIGQALATILLLALVVFASIAFFYIGYGATLVFIETLSFSAMMKPQQWRRKINGIGKAEFIKLILMLIFVGFVAGIIAAIIGTVVRNHIVLTSIVSTVIGQYLTMLSIVWLGYFVRGEQEQYTDGCSANEQAKLLYHADTHGMSDAEKQQLATDLQQADNEYAAGQPDNAIAQLEPYIRDEAKAPQYYPVYQRLLEWYPHAARHNKYNALQSRIIRIAAQGHERFYQLIDDTLLTLAIENNAQIAADDVYPLCRQALEHRQYETVLALAKDFRKRDAAHPDVVKVYACTIDALIGQGHHDIAKQVAEGILVDYPNHSDAELIQTRLERLKDTPD